jgi:hypothetical protein
MITKKAMTIRGENKRSFFLENLGSFKLNLGFELDSRSESGVVLSSKSIFFNKAINL